MPDATCSIGDCDRPVSARGWCHTHYDRWRRNGDPLVTKTGGTPITSPADRFWAKVDKDGPGGCWLWTGRLIGHGYGRLRIADGHVYAHRFAYELLVGPIPDGLHIDHLCTVHSCVNPDHLEPVTMAENNRRAAAHNRET